MVVYSILVPTLLIKLKRSEVGLDSTKPAFDQLTESCIQRKLPVESWRTAERLAMEERGDSLRIFDIKHKKPPTLSQITLQLTENNGAPSDNADEVDWISNGIKTQNEQLVSNYFYLCFFDQVISDPDSEWK